MACLDAAVALLILSILSGSFGVLQKLETCYVSKTTTPAIKDIAFLVAVPAFTYTSSLWAAAALFNSNRNAMSFHFITQT